jgi:ABC-type sugar transport system ATPase subunit
MRDGAVEQVAPPLEIYSYPANTFVAGFIGAPSMNLFPAETLGINRLAATVAGIRPHDVSFAAGGSISARVELVEPRGHDCLVHLRLLAPGTPTLVAISTVAPTPGEVVFPQIRRERLHLFGRDGRRLDL